MVTVVGAPAKCKIALTYHLCRLQVHLPCLHNRIIPVYALWPECFHMSRQNIIRMSYILHVLSACSLNINFHGCHSKFFHKPVSNCFFSRCSSKSRHCNTIDILSRPPDIPRTTFFIPVDMSLCSRPFA